MRQVVAHAADEDDQLSRYLGGPSSGPAIRKAVNPAGVKNMIELTRTFRDSEDLVGLHILQDLLDATRPGQLNRVHDRGRA
ncbi:MAG TPA: hypothetical protein VMH04_10430 [Candidatus Solibacter sp.]|nr:hypothetical protein [Candidatus Solibacter sp.]